MMGKTLAIRAVISGELNKLCKRVFYDHAELDNEAVYPYLIYSLNELSYEDGLTQFKLEINTIDYGSNSKACDDLADAIQANLHHFFYLGQDVELMIYRGPRSDRRIIRRRLTFEIRAHERG